MSEPGADRYTVRRFVPADAEGIAALVRQVYGTGYAYHEELYHPEEIIRLNATGGLFSAVALDPTGALVGHGGLILSDDGRTAETGESMVAPEHRSHHLMHRMREVLHEEAARLGLVGVHGESVTNHVFSQKVYEAFDAHPCGIMLATAPASCQNLPQRMSFVLYFKFLSAPPTTKVHVPEQHGALIKRIYEQFPVPVQFREGEPLSGEGQLAVLYRTVVQVGMIQVRSVGANVPAEIVRARDGLLVMGADPIYLDLPLGRSQTPELCRAAERAGFHFSAIVPLAVPDGDVLRLQQVRVPINPALVQIESPFARELLAYTIRERDRIASLGTS
ncbi:MAG: hypothetical protein K2R98_24275 [Gemmataceae bacterium]|nr:hypothetical protein [Gemmataceae bacterium]